MAGDVLQKTLAATAANNMGTSAMQIKTAVQNVKLIIEEDIANSRRYYNGAVKKATKFKNDYLNNVEAVCAVCDAAIETSNKIKDSIGYMDNADDPLGTSSN